VKAAVVHEFGAEEVLRYEDVSDPTPAPDEVLIRVRAAGINRGDLGRRMGTYAAAVALPFIIGWDIAGTVASAGQDVTGFRPGDRVVARVPQGGYAELAAAPAHQTVKIPAGVSFEQAAALPVAYLTSWFALKHQGALQPGETCLVQAAASGVGVAGIQIAKAMGARVLTTASTEKKLELGRRLGADVAINYTTTDFVEVVQRETDRRGVDVVLESGASGRAVVPSGASTGQFEAVELRQTLSHHGHVLGPLELLGPGSDGGREEQRPSVEVRGLDARAGQPHRPPFRHSAHRAGTDGVEPPGMGRDRGTLAVLGVDRGEAKVGGEQCRDQPLPIKRLPGEDDRPQD